MAELRQGKQLYILMCPLPIPVIPHSLILPGGLLSKRYPLPTHTFVCIYKRIYIVG